MSMPNIFNVIKSVKFQLTCLLVAMIYVVTILVVEHKKDNFSEKLYPILKVKENIKRLASNVDVGLYVNNFPQFSFDQNEFTLDAFVWFRFPVGTESLSTIEKFDFKNGDIKYKSKPMIKLIEDEVVVTYQVKSKFKTYLDYKNFPLGDHRLNIILENINVTPNELSFNIELDNFVLSEDILVRTWRPTKKMVQAGYLKSPLNSNQPEMEVTYPCAVFTIDFENISLQNLITLYFPMYVIFFICLFSLMIEIPEYLFRMNVISTAMPILILFRMVIVQLSPTIGEITKVDFAYFLLVFLSLIILLFQAYVVLAMKKVKQYNKETQKKKIVQLEKTSNFVFIIVILLLVTILTFNVF